MKPLKTIQQVLTWLCIYPTENNTGIWRKFICMVTASIVIGTLSAAVLAGLAFVRKFIAVDFNSSLDAVYVVMGFIPLINSFVMMILLNHYIVAIFDALNNIYDERKSVCLIEEHKHKNNTEKILLFSRNSGIKKRDGSTHILIKVDGKCEQASNFYFKYAIFWPGVSTITSFLLPVLWVVFTHQPFNRDDLYMPYKLLYVYLMKHNYVFNYFTFFSL